MKDWAFPKKSRYFQKREMEKGRLCCDPKIISPLGGTFFFFHFTAIQAILPHYSHSQRLQASWIGINWVPNEVLMLTFLVSVSLGTTILSLVFNCLGNIPGQYFYFMFSPASGEHFSPFSKHMTKFNMVVMTRHAGSCPGQMNWKTQTI